MSGWEDHEEGTLGRNLKDVVRCARLARTFRMEYLVARGSTSMSMVNRTQ